MIVIFISAVLFNTGLCQTVPPSVIDDLWNILYNLPVAFQNCDTVQVLPSNIIYTLYKQDNKDNGITLNNTNLNTVNARYRVIFIIHGWLQDSTQSWIIQMKDRYLEIGPANVITVDWSQYSGINYGAAFCAVPQVGAITGDLIFNLITAVNIILSDVQINGFSLGGQVAGYTGQEIQNKTGGRKIGRINGLDAAGPGYLGIATNQRLDAEDATFVQGIHTNNNMFGYTYAYATVDFQLNCVLPINIWITPVTPCGTIQPCCPLNPGVPPSNDLSEILPIVFCNHIRAAVYFIASINSTDSFGVPCSCTRFGLGLCTKQPTTVMGEHCPSTASGELFLNPSGTPPYSKGSAGTGGICPLNCLLC